MAQFRNKVAVVIGASSEGGVGWAVAERFAREGAHVVVAARRMAELQRLAKKIDGAALPCDIGDEASVVALAQAVKTRFGAVNLLVNAAGAPAPGVLASIDTASLQATTATEFHGTWFMLKHFGPLMADKGAIVAVSSLSATMVCPGFIAYAAAKAASNSLVRYAAIELAPRGVRVNSVMPGLIDTPMNQAFSRNKAVMDVLLKEVPLSRMASADEIASAIQWLCQDDCFATGVALTVDGGNHLRRAPYPDELPVTTYASEAP